jgi:hypothetical protein
MIISYKTLLKLLSESGLPDQGASPTEALYIEFDVPRKVELSEEFVTGDGRLMKLDLGHDRDLLGIEIV